MTLKRPDINKFIIMQSAPTHPNKQDEDKPNRSNEPNRVDAGRLHGRLAAMLMGMATAMLLMAGSTQAQNQGGSKTSGIAHREIARRAGLVVEADKSLMLGRTAYAKKDYEEAAKQYQMALNMLPPGPALADRRQSYTGHLGDATVALAQQYRRTGRYDEARNLLEVLLLRDPANFAATKELEYLDDPIRTNPALTFEHSKNVDQVRRHLYKGEGYYNLGQYDEAEGEFKNVLQIDSYNKAARRWMEKIAATKSDYYRAAYDHTRAELLKEVDRAWETTVPPDEPNFGPGEGSTVEATGVQYIQQKLNNIMIPVVDFEDYSVQEALDLLRLRAREADPERKGINFIIRDPGMGGDALGAGGDEAGLDAGAAGALDAPSIGSLKINELKLNDVPLGVVLQYICDKTRLRYKLDSHSVIILPMGALEADDLYTREFIVPPDFISSLSQGGGGGGEDDDPFGGGGGENDRATLADRPSAKETLMDNGVPFAGEASANYIPSSSRLVVKNTLANLDTIEGIIEVLRKGGPRQVRILTKFIEVKQENTDELGFDWVINPFISEGSDSVFFLGGGTTGNGSTRTPQDLGNPSILGAGAQSVSNISTAGLRSGDYSVTRNNIDAILNNPNRTAQSSSVAPGILSITGLFNDGEAQMIMRGLSQKKGTDVMTAPSILAMSGEKATIEVIREFIYPTEYEPPEIPQSTAPSSNSSDGGGTQGGIFPVTPATPTAFETRNTGVTLEVEPTIGENDYTISLRFIPELVEFEGFINYGSPIQSFATDLVGNPITITITENRIEQPVFATRKVETGLTIYDGYTVAVGGLMREDVQNVEDKVPVLGDLPLIGRLFQSKTENHIKSNLIIFVTAEIIDAAGRRVNQPSSSAPGAGGVAPQAPMPVDGAAGLLPPMPAR